MVELKNVSVTYSSGVDALNDVSLRINDGDFTFVVGSSGAGKSTMIKLLLKEIDATSGSVIVNGYNLNKLRKKRIPEFRRTLGFVFQDFRLIPSMTVYENIAFVLRVIDAPTKQIKKRVPYVIDLVGLHDKMNSYPDELSGGEKQRVAIARALVNDPQLIIADEPTGNIDPELSYEIVELLKGINDQGTTILMVTHEHDLVRHFGGRIINISEGRIAYDDVITGLGELPEEIVEDIAEADDLDGEFPMETMAGSFADESEIIQTVGPDFDLSQEVAATPDEEEIIPVADSISGTEEDIPLSLDDMTPEDIISAITEEKAEEAAPAETTEEIREQAQAILEEAEKKLAAVTAMHEEEAAKLAEEAENTAETAAENVPEPIKAEETPSEVSSGKKHYRKKKHKRSANNKNSASDNDNGGAV
ncbi:MAG: cell division ATP-binding protein FtsE [Ruminococcus sp.]|nr:cell division ATP-binding protein FtsE [Ruminococcus sp.]